MAPTTPSAGDVHVNRPLTNFSEMYVQGEESFNSLRAVPNVRSTSQSDLYWTIDKGDWNRNVVQKRANGAPTVGGAYTQSTTAFTIDVYGVHKDVTDRDRANEDAETPVSLDEGASMYVSSQMLQKHELLFADAFLKTGVWTTDLVLAGATQWTNASSDPIVQMRTAARTIQQSTGGLYRPNRLVLGRDSWDALLDNPAIQARITGGANPSNPAITQQQLVAALFQIESIFVMDSIQTTSTKGATDAFGFISSDSALLYYAPSVVAKGTPTAMARFDWTGLMGVNAAGMRVKRFRRPEEFATDRVEGEFASEYKLIAADLGYFFSDTNA